MNYKKGEKLLDFVVLGIVSIFLSLANVTLGLQIFQDFGIIRFLIEKEP